MFSWMIYSVLVGLAAGFIASRLMGLDSNDVISNLALGVLGSFVGGFVGRLIGLEASGFIGSIIMAVIGACVAIWIYRKFLRH